MGSSREVVTCCLVFVFLCFGFLVFWYGRRGVGSGVVEVGAGAMRRERVRRMLWSLYIYMDMCVFLCLQASGKNRLFFFKEVFSLRKEGLRRGVEWVNKDVASKQHAGSQTATATAMLECFFLQIQYREMH